MYHAKNNNFGFHAASLPFKKPSLERKNNEKKNINFAANKKKHDTTDGHKPRVCETIDTLQSTPEVVNENFYTNMRYTTLISADIWF